MSPQHFESSVEIAASAQRAYALWSDCENFPKFMQGVVAVHRLDERHLHWRAEMWGESLQWNAEILEDIPETRISWRITTGDKATGTVHFLPLQPDRVRVRHEMDLTAENSEHDAAEFQARITEDLERFRQFVEKSH